jgi:hypothetical protein
LRLGKVKLLFFLVKMKIDFPLSFSSFPPQKKNPCLKLLLIFNEYLTSSKFVPIIVGLLELTTHKRLGLSISVMDNLA